MSASGVSGRRTAARQLRQLRQLRQRVAAVSGPVRGHATRAAFRTAERVLPGVGAVLAERLWFTVPPLPRAAGREPADLPPYEPIEVRVDGRTVRGRAYGSGPLVLLVHGWGGWGMQLAAYVAPLVGSGHRVVLYDALSHGSSDPGPSGARRSSVLELVAGLHAVIETQGEPVAVIAHSLGAMAVADVIKDGLVLERAVLVAPSQHPEHLTFFLADLLGFGPRVRARLVDRVERRVGMRLGDLDAAAVGRAVPTPPTLVVHDRDDPSTPYAGGVAIASAWPDATLVTTSGLGHHRVLRDRAVVADVVGFVAERVRTAEGPGLVGSVV